MTREGRTTLKRPESMRFNLLAKSNTILTSVALLLLVFVWTTDAWGRVVISSPVNGATIPSLVQLIVVTSGSPTSISVYDNNTQIIQGTAISSIQASLNLVSGSHRIRIVALYRTADAPDSEESATSTIKVSAAAPASLILPAQIADDMAGLNEGNPQGVPLNWDWANGPVMGAGDAAPAGWDASTAWGVVYIAAEGNRATNTRVNVRNQQLYFLSLSTGLWALLQNTSQPDGEAYPEDLSGNNSKAADIRTEPDGTISVTAGMGAWAGYNFHFYPHDRGAINRSDVGGVVACFEARLIVGNPSLPDDRNTANYLAESGADYWPSATGGLPPSYNGIVPPVANGKFKYIQSNWRSFCITTMTQADLMLNPPPIDFTGILP